MTYWQVVLSVSQLMWCKDLTTCLTSDDIMEQVKQAEQRCFQVTSFNQYDTWEVTFIICWTESQQVGRIGERVITKASA